MTRVVLTDIEGTTSSIAFVKAVLFPYARRELARYVRAHEHDGFVKSQLDSIRSETGAHQLDDVIATLERFIDEDRKHTALKALQGRIWERGYREGVYRAHVYPDAASALRAWHAAGLTLCVYSSGSVPAQQLFFEHTVEGDLRPLFAAYFDTTTGPKQSADSYRAIVSALDVPASEVLFLSDVEAELDAALAAGLRTTWLVRPEDRNAMPSELRDSRHPWVRTFADITL